jgi:hypothetical protein
MDDDDEFDGPEYEWIEWTEAELDATPNEVWSFVCEGLGERYRKHKFTFERGNEYSSHKPFKLGKACIDRNGNFVIEPRFDDVMHVDMDHKTVTFTCQHDLCVLNYTIRIDKFVVIMSQTFERRDHYEEDDTEWENPRPMRYARQVVDVASTFAESNAVSDGPWWQKKLDYFMAEYNKHERTVTIRSKSGDTLITP